MRHGKPHKRTEPEKKRGGRPPKLTPERLRVLRRIGLEHPTDTLDELSERLARETGVKVSWLTTMRGLRKVGLVRQRPDRTTDRKAEAPAEREPKSYGYTAAHREVGKGEDYPSSLTDAEWSLVSDVFEKKGRGKPPKYARRGMLDACCYVVRSGCSWRMLPKGFPPWEDVYKTFRRWTRQKKFEVMHDRLRGMWRERENREVGPTAAVLDSQSVKTSPQGGPKGFDGGKKVKGRKRHLLVDTLGLLLAVCIQPASVQDRDGAAPVVEEGLAKYPSVRKLYVDGGYGGQCAHDLRSRLGLDVEVVRHPGNRTVGRLLDAQLPLFDPPTGFVVLPKRWVIERTNGWNDRPRRLNKDHDRRLDVSAAWIWLAEARLLARRIAWDQLRAVA
jgi:putative transposase